MPSHYCWLKLPQQQYLSYCRYVQDRHPKLPQQTSIALFQICRFHYSMLTLFETIFQTKKYSSWTI